MGERELKSESVRQERLRVSMRLESILGGHRGAAPNPAVQRTRSRGSLTARPLGSLIIGVAIALTGCAQKFDSARVTAETGIAKFHASFNEQQFGQIYQAADLRLRHSVAEAQFTDMMRKFRQELGRCVGVKLKRWQGAKISDGTVILIVAESEFEHGRVVEEFEFLVNGGTARLVRYTIPPGGSDAKAA